MTCNGSVILHAQCDGDHREHTIDALVSEDLRDDALLSWHDLRALRVLPDKFPEVIRACTQIKSLEASVADLKEEFKDILCDGLSPEKMMKGPPMKIHLRTDIEIKPKKYLTSRRIPVHWESEATRVVQDLLEKGILKPVTLPTEWISCGHFVPKEGGKQGLRLVTDYTGINQYVKRPVHPFPSTLDVIQSVRGDSKWFAKLDAVQGYHQIPLDEESSYLTTFILPSGRYRYTRAPMGLSASGDEWCQRSDVALQDVEGVSKLVDDILVQARTQDELLVRLRAVLSRCREHGIYISMRKLQFGQSVKYAGHIVDEIGVRPDPEKLAAIRDFKSPTDLTSLRSFLGLANQLGQHFIPDLTHMTSKMRCLLKKDVAFLWLPEHEMEFVRAKELLTSPTVVQHFRPDLDSVLLTDASRLYGLGYALGQLHGEKLALVSCGSCSLSDAQRNYATIELECLAIQWAVNKCAFYLRGSSRPFKVITDHRPLVGLFKKPLHECENPRLQRLREKLVAYNFSVEWEAGKNHQIADALSRAPVFGPEEDDIALVRVVNADLEPILAAAASDPVYVATRDALRQGLDCVSLPVGHPARSLSSVWTMLSLMDERENTLIVYDGHRIFVPESYRADILRVLHVPHAGIVKTRQSAKSLYYWPGMYNEVKQMIEKCTACQNMLPSQQLEPMLEPKASAPMSDVGVDLCDIAGRTWLIMVDRYSGYPFAKVLTRLGTSTVVKVLRAWFCDYGFPIAIRTDGGPQFRSEFDEFCKRFNIRHELSSAYNPRSNGLAESAVKNIKHLILKCLNCEEDLDLAISEFRNCPRADGFSPAQRLFGRRQRGLLPALPATLAPIDRDAADKAKDAALRDLQVQHDARASKSALPELAVGTYVHCQHPVSGKWDTRGEVVSVRDNRRSYNVKLDDGRITLRNRRFLRPIFSAVQNPNSEDADTADQDSNVHRDQIVTESNSEIRRNRDQSRDRSCTERDQEREKADEAASEKLPRRSSRLAAKQ